MERLFVDYNDKGKIRVVNKRNGIVKGFFDRLPKSMIKTAYIQRYPKKDYPPIMLVEDGIITTNGGH